MEFSSSDEEDSIKTPVQDVAEGKPGLEGTESSRIKYMEKGACRRALRNPGDESRFRAYDLNQPRDPTRETIVPVDQWQSCLAENPLERRGGAYTWASTSGSLPV